jgi:hypothetical protein
LPNRIPTVQESATAEEKLNSSNAAKDIKKKKYQDYNIYLVAFPKLQINDEFYKYD